MSFAITYSRANCGIHALTVTVEIHISGGLPRVSIVGLPETAVKESKDRVRSALLNMKFSFPPSRLTINLAPADLPKEGGRFDLAIAIGILAATGQIHSTALTQYEFAGELALSGELRPIKGVLPFALATKQQGRTLIIPQANANEAALVKGLTILPVTHFLDVCAHLCGKTILTPFKSPPLQHTPPTSTDLAQLSGQIQARRALEIAAAGGHSMLMTGPPGTGKTMLVNCLVTILPAMTEEEALASAMIMSISQQRFN
ncbi:MAG: ATP-binding protein [Gammaproteobacteria bacterium]|nr:ATP-binding protein [Gammaproteobacteria bacterium]